MRNLRTEIGTKIRRLREERKLSREVFCKDESELTVRQLVRIEKGESLPSLPKLEYIATVLGIPMARIVDEETVTLPPRYLELKHRLIHFMTYGDEERISLKDSWFDDIYEHYFEILPEEEQVAVEVMQAAFDIFVTEQASYGESLIEEYFDQLMVKDIYSVNDLLIIKLYLFMMLAGRKDESVAVKLIEKMSASIDYSNETALYLVVRNIVALSSYYFQNEQYNKLTPYLDILDHIIQNSNALQQKPGIDLIRATYILFIENDQKKAEKLFDQAILCAEVLGEKVLAEKMGRDKDRLLEKWEKQQKSKRYFEDSKYVTSISW